MDKFPRIPQDSCALYHIDVKCWNDCKRYNYQSDSNQHDDKRPNNEVFLFLKENYIDVYNHVSISKIVMTNEENVLL